MTRLSIFIVLLFSFTTSKAQVTDVKLRLDYVASTQQYDCYLIAVAGCANDFASTIQANSQISVVVPKSGEVSVVQNYNPLTINGNQPMVWTRQNIAGHPDPAIDEAYHSIVPSLNPTAAYTSICAGDEIKLFSLSVADIKCDDEVRLWKNNEDPGTEILSGANFNNGFTVGAPMNIYSGNVDPLSTPTAGTPSEVFICEGNCIDIAASECLYKSFDWSTGDTSSSIMVCPTTSTTYNVTLTDFDDVVTVATYQVNVGADLPDLDFNVSVSDVCVGVNFAIFPPLDDPLELIPLDQDVVTINSTGGFRPIAAGTTGFTLVNTETGCSKSTDLIVTVNDSPEIIAPAEKQICIGETLTLSLENPTSGTWTSNNSGIVSINNSGTLTAVSQGLGLLRFTSTATSCPSNFMDITVRAADNPLCVTATENQDFRELVLFPNPTADLFTLEHLETGSKVEIVDIFGRILLQSIHKSSQPLQVDTGDWHAGIYIVRVSAGVKKKALKLHIVR